MGFVSGSGYRIGDPNLPYFVTFTVVKWVDIFTRKRYRDIVVDSIKYCQQNKGLLVYSYVIMSNHLHMIMRANEGYELSNIIRDFKKYTARQILDSIEEEPESRKGWMLALFKTKASYANQKPSYRFWQATNHPIVLNDHHVVKETRDYIHNNPVVAGIVEVPEHYLYSSARNFAGLEAVIEIEEIGLV